MNIFSTNHFFEFGVADYPEGGTFGPLGPIYRSHLAVILQRKGTSDITVDDRPPFALKRGAAGLIYCQYCHEVRNPPSKKAHYLYCSTGVIRRPQIIVSNDPLIPVESQPIIAQVPQTLAPSRILKELMNIGVQLQQDTSAGAQRVRHTLGETVFNEYFRLAHIEDDEDPTHQAVSRARRYIESHYQDHCNLTIIAEAAAVTPQHLIRLFKKYIGITPIRYLWQVRAKHAIHLLKTSGLTVSTIATRCGFKDTFHFSRYIKTHYKASPNKLRRRHWQNRG